MNNAILRISPVLAVLASGCSASQPQRSELLPAQSAPAAPPALSAASSVPPSQTAKVTEPRAPECSPLEVEPVEIITTPFDLPLPPLIDSEARGLASFYRRFAELLRGKANDHVRIAFYGDSNLTEDLLTGEMRRVLQARYDDAGHGYVAFDKP